MNKAEVFQVLISLSAIIGIALVYEKVFQTDHRLAAIAMRLLAVLRNMMKRGTGVMTAAKHTHIFPKTHHFTSLEIYAFDKPKK